MAKVCHLLAGRDMQFTQGAVHDPVVYPKVDKGGPRGAGDPNFDQQARVDIFDFLAREP